MAVQDDSYALIYGGNTKIGTLIPDCVLEEVYEDRLQVTSHPVERGSNVSDHAFLLPKLVDMKIGWADYKGGSSQYSTSRYEQLLRIQAIREPVNLSCGKRNYRNMLPVAISVVHDQKTKYVVMATVRMQEIRISSARTQNVGAVAPNPSNQLAPQTTQSRVNSGPVQPSPGRVNDNPTNGVPPDASSSILPSPSIPETPPI